MKKGQTKNVKTKSHSNVCPSINQSSSIDLNVTGFERHQIGRLKSLELGEYE